MDESRRSNAFNSNDPDTPTTNQYSPSVDQVDLTNENRNSIGETSKIATSINKPPSERRREANSHLSLEIPS